MSTYPHLFYKHIEGFLLNHLPTHSTSVMVAVSGGVDSMVLMHVAHHFLKMGKLRSLRVVTVHHGTRSGQDEEVAFVAQSAKDLGLECVVIHREAGGANDELSLREFRYQKLYSFMRSEEELWMAHHLDDSWEWAQLQMARSSESRAVLGIPMKSAAVVRPFLCVTKKQIYRMARALKLSWHEDPTNQGAGYARALFRQKFAPQLQSQHPQFLKHYAHRSQRIAESWGVALKMRREVKIHRAPYGSLIRGECSEQILIDEIKKYSESGRGSLHKEVKKILKAIENKKKGPFTLSGGVKVSLYQEWIWVYKKQFSPPLFPENLKFETMNKTEFEAQLTRAIKKKLDWTPFWVVFNPDRNAQNTLVKEAKDALWAHLPINTCVISAPKLLARWIDPQQSLDLALPWAISDLLDP